MAVSMWIWRLGARILWTSTGSPVDGARLSPPVVPDLGFSQGCRLAATAYVEVGKLRTRALMSVGDCWLSSGVSLSEVVFSDDRRWFGRFVAEVSRMARSGSCVITGLVCAQQPGKNELHIIASVVRRISVSLCRVRLCPRQRGAVIPRGARGRRGFPSAGYASAWPPR